LFVSVNTSTHDTKLIIRTFYPDDGQQRIAQYRSCAFGGTATGSNDKFVDIGNEDVRSLVWGSIDRFHEFRNGIDRVQARGDLCCLSCDQDTTHRLDWGLYAMKGMWPPNSNIVLGKANNGGRYNFTEEEYQAFREGRGELPEPEGDGTVVWWAGEEKGGLKTGDDR
jgi:Pathogen effector